MNNNKKLPSQNELFMLIHEWIIPMINRKQVRLGGNWNMFNGTVRLYWELFGSNEKLHCGCACLRFDHWEIYNGFYEEDDVNIRIFKDSIEFNENSKFIDFTRDEMYSLYEFLKERIFGNNTERLPEIIKDPTNVNIFKHIKSVMQRYPDDSPEYNVLFDLYHTIKASFNTEYGMSVNAPEPDREAMIEHATDLVNNFDKETQSSDDIKEDN